MVVVERAETWLLVIILAALALVGVGAFADRLLPQSLACEAPPMLLPAE